MANKKPMFFLGDPEFTKKMMVLYGWIMPVTFTGMFILFVVSKAWITSFLFLAVAVLYYPGFKDRLAKFGIKGLFKAIIAIAFIVLAVASINYYV